jgi:hypothetical protein
MSESSKLDPSRVASKKLAPYKLAPLKLAFRTMLCWNATPLKFWLEKSDWSRLTPRVMAMVRPDCRVLAPPVAILLFATLLAPPPTASAARASGMSLLNKTAAKAAAVMATSANAFGIGI